MARTITDKLREPFSENEVEWRVQQAGKSGEKIWCMVLAYIDARALQNRLDEVFTPFGWADEYEEINGSFICTLTVENGGKRVSKQNGASQTQVEGFKGGISNSFKRVCASGFGIGRYLYDLDTMFAETTTTDPKNKDWIKSSFKDKQSGQYVKYWFKKPQMPEYAKPTATDEQIKDLRELIDQKGSSEDAIIAFTIEKYGVSKLENLSTNQYMAIEAMLKAKKDKKND